MSDFEARLLSAESMAQRIGRRMADGEIREAALENLAWLGAGRPSAGGAPLPASWTVLVQNGNTLAPVVGALVQVTDSSGSTILASGTTTSVSGYGQVTLSWSVSPSENCLVRRLEVTATGLNPSPYVEFQSIAYLSGGYDITSLMQLF